MHFNHACFSHAYPHHDFFISLGTFLFLLSQTIDCSPPRRRDKKTQVFFFVLSKCPLGRHKHGVRNGPFLLAEIGVDKNSSRGRTGVSIRVWRSKGLFTLQLRQRKPFPKGGGFMEREISSVLTKLYLQFLVFPMGKKWGSITYSPSH